MSPDGPYNEHLLRTVVTVVTIALAVLAFRLPTGGSRTEPVRSHAYAARDVGEA